MENNWLQQIKVGDKIAIRRTENRGYLISNVSRVTKTLIIAGNDRFNKVSGYSVGDDIWSTSHLEEITQQIEDEIALNNLITRCKQLMREIPLSKLTIIELKSIISILGKYQ